MGIHKMKTWERTVSCPECGKLCNYFGIGSHRYLKHRKNKNSVVKKSEN